MGSRSHHLLSNHICCETSSPDLPQMFLCGLGVPCMLYLPMLFAQFWHVAHSAMVPCYPSFLVSLFQSHAALVDDDSQQIYVFDIHLTELQVVLETLILLCAC